MLHAGRVSLLLAIVALLRGAHVEREPVSHDQGLADVDVATLRALFPSAANLADTGPTPGSRTVLDAAGQPIGYVLQTSPESDSIVGYSGPTNVLIGFDDQDHVAGLRILSSGDTRDHVELVRRDERFLGAARGQSWEELSAGERVDGVSGATLTSLAVEEAVSYRLSGERRPSLKFPRPLTLDEVRSIFPAAVAIQSRAEQPLLWDVMDGEERRLGSIVRSAPWSDDEMGYQGPSESLLVLGADGQLVSLHLRESYDNEPYVERVRDDEYFRTLWSGKSLSELAGLDAEAARVEGVSGATMTSQAVARGVPKAAQAASTRPEPAAHAWLRVRDVGTIAVVMTALLVGFSPWRGNRGVRIAYQLALIGYLGFLNGDMVSQALLVGWARHGVAWRSAPGLTVLTAAALIVPIVTKRQLYCHHLCPYGALQQLVRPRSRSRFSVATSMVRQALAALLPFWRKGLRKTISRSVARCSPVRENVGVPPFRSNGTWRWSRLAEVVPLILLAVVVWVGMRGGTWNLASLEPFDAFLLRAAGAATLSLAVLGLVAAATVPMAYCRYGCPTG
ncbi:MAG: FMN-binding protein, partial [Pirellulaceae bacterium]